MPSLAAGSGAFLLTGYGLRARLMARAGEFVLTGMRATLTRSLNVDLGSLVLRLDRLQSTVSYFDDMGRPTQQMQLLWQRHCESIERAFGALRDSILAIQAAYNAAAQASAAASDAANAATEAREAVEGVIETVSAIEDGTYNFPALRVGGDDFVNAGTGSLVAQE